MSCVCVRVSLTEYCEQRRQLMHHRNIRRSPAGLLTSQLFMERSPRSALEIILFNHV